MTRESRDPFLDGLVYEDRLPLGWELSGDALEPAALVRLNVENESALRVISLLEEQHTDNSDQSPEISREIARLDLKLNLLVDLFSQLLTQYLALPDPVPLRLSARGIEWICSAPPVAGARILIKAYLYPKYPRPFALPGQVVAVDVRPEGYLVRAVFLDLSEAVHDGLEKFIFRHHRRSIAHARTLRTRK